MLSNQEAPPIAAVPVFVPAPAPAPVAIKEEEKKAPKPIVLTYTGDSHEFQFIVNEEETLTWTPGSAHPVTEQQADYLLEYFGSVFEKEK